VRDDGPGFAQEIIDRLGDPFVTTRKGYGAMDEAAERHEGMGLGFFIAKTLLERSGASVALANKPPPDHRAIARIPWPQPRPEARAVVLTGYGNIATAVTAVKIGAIDYLAKPADADAVYGALIGSGDNNRTALPENPMSADRVRWEHIQRVYELCNRNVSETARRLNMHRRTLQRILAKRAPK